MIGASTPGTNITAAMLVKISGKMYKINPTQAPKQLVQLNGLKFNFHLICSWCISTKNKAKLIAAKIIISVIVF
jgi:hypothetical protein